LVQVSHTTLLTFTGTCRVRNLLNDAFLHVLRDWNFAADGAGAVNSTAAHLVGALRFALGPLAWLADALAGARIKFAFLLTHPLHHFAAGDRVLFGAPFAYQF